MQAVQTLISPASSGTWQAENSEKSGLQDFANRDAMSVKFDAN